MYARLLHFFVMSVIISQLEYHSTPNLSLPTLFLPLLQSICSNIAKRKLLKQTRPCIQLVH